MRTTINLPDDLLARLRKVAAESRTTMTALIEDALREALARRRRAPRRERGRLTTFGAGGLQPGVDLDDTAALLDLTEPPSVPDRRYINVLVYAHRADAHGHARYREWLGETLDADAAFGLSDLVLSGFLRVATHPRIFRDPSPLETALAFAAEIRDRPNCVSVTAGDRHWDIFTRLCRAAGARGSLVPDAYLAALAIEAGAEWVTTDRDYARFPGLRWRHPLD